MCACALVVTEAKPVIMIKLHILQIELFYFYIYIVIIRRICVTPPPSSMLCLYIDTENLSTDHMTTL